MLQLARTIAMVFIGLLMVMMGIFYWLVYDENKVFSYSELQWIDENAIAKIERINRTFSAYDKLRFHLKRGEIWDYDLNKYDNPKIADLDTLTKPYSFLRLYAFPDPIDQLNEIGKRFVVVQIADESGVLSSYDENAERIQQKYKNQGYFGAILMLIGLLILQLSRTLGMKQKRKNRKQVKQPHH